MNGYWILIVHSTYAPTKSWFALFKDLDYGLVLLGNDNPCKIKGIGTIKLRMYDGLNMIIQQARYIPELKRNLISLGTLESNKYFLKLDNGNMRMLKGSLLTMQTIRINSLYFLIRSTVVGGASMVQEAANKSNLWHLSYKRKITLQRVILSQRSYSLRWSNPAKS